ncbi:MAG: copper transport protein [Solirubrobacteraceae bacterium]|nr:copper transport protein [Solirubrobacteraceae bacterium]
MRRARAGGVAAVVAAAIVLASAPGAWAHAALLGTAPAASRITPHGIGDVALTFSETVEPRFAVISVTDAKGHQLATGSAARSLANPHTIVRPVARLRPGWYLVYWRVISADGHPVRGAFTFAIGPGPGPPRQFAVPSLRETAATPGLLAARWAVLLALMAAIGLFVFRAAVARPVGATEEDRTLRAVTVAGFVATGAALVLVPVYLLLSTATFAARSALDIGALLPLARLSSFGRGIGDLEVLLALFAVAAGVAVWLDRPDRPRRSVVELLAGASALVCGAMLLLVLGLAGHPAQTAPRGLALALDWTHLAAGSVWLGGLVGLLVLWGAARRGRRMRALAVVVPRFSRVALGAVLTLIATGTLQTIEHLPTLSALWQTAYGRSIAVKIGLLGLALILGAVNLLVTTPRLAAAGAREDPALGGGGARLLRRTVSGEVVLVASAVFAAGLLTSLPPPASALGRAGDALARVGPGPVRRPVAEAGTRAVVRLTPNVAVRPMGFGVDLARGGAPVTGATVVARFDMLDMDMAQQAFTLRETRPGTYQRTAMPLIMVGNWGVTFDVTPRSGPPYSFVVVDRANG